MSSLVQGEQEVVAALALLDCAAAKNGTISESDFSDFLKNDNALETLTRFIVPSGKKISALMCSIEEGEEEVRIKRSFYAMMLLIQLASYNKTASFMKDEDSISGKIGLICKMLFQAFRPEEGTVTPYIPHVNHLLQNLLIHFPSVVVSSACAGGKNGIHHTLEQMIVYKPEQISTSSPALALFSDIIIMGCCGTMRTGSSSNFNTAADSTNGTSTMIKKSVRRKFIHSLCEWGLVPHMVSLLTASDQYCSSCTHPNPTSVKIMYSMEQEILAFDLHVDGICDALITVTDAIAFPTITSGGATFESCGESALLKPFGDDDFVKGLISVAASQATARMTSLQRRATTAARALMTIFKLSFERRKPDPTLESGGASDTEVPPPAATTYESTMLAIGIADRMYQNLLLALQSIVTGILFSIPNIDDPIDITGEKSQQNDEEEGSGVYHPGRTFVKRPFTTRRLHLVTLLADVLFYECESKGASSSLAMDALMELCNKPNMEELDPSNSSNVWSGLIHLLFSYPNNNLFQVQFYRLFSAILIQNHEPTLKLVLQKCKLVTLFLKATLHSSSPCLQGCILQCLNAIRLRYQSLPPKSTYLCSYLDSHDGWKAFLPKMLETTKEQRIFGGGIAVCPNVVNEEEWLEQSTRRRSDEIVLDDYFESSLPLPASPTTVVHVQQEDYSEIDLGSPFAAELGFNMFKKYTVQETLPVKPSSAEDAGHALIQGKKTKKKNKKGKKK